MPYPEMDMERPAANQGGGRCVFSRRGDVERIRYCRLRRRDPEGVFIDSWSYDPSNDLVDSRGSGEVIAEHPVGPGRGASVGAITYIGADVRAARRGHIAIDPPT